MVNTRMENPRGWEDMNGVKVAIMKDNFLRVSEMGRVNT